MSLTYLTAEKRDFSPFFDLHFVVQIDATTSKDFSFPLYNDTRPFTEEEYNADVKAEIEYEMSLILTPPVEPDPVPLEDF